jgi:phosphoserine aminotransferase
VFERLLKLGGLEAVEKVNKTKAGKIYDAIAASNGFYKCPVEPSVRSLMNIPFTMATPELEKAFLKACEQRGLLQLKGHRSVGGIRASVYNAMPMEGVDALVQLMKVRITAQLSFGFPPDCLAFMNRSSQRARSKLQSALR